jgi:hypothetical protein
VPSQKLSLGTLLLKSVGAGYGALNIAGRNAAIEILEFSPLGEKSQLVVKGSSDAVRKYVAVLRTADIERSLVIDDVDERVIRSYLSLDNVDLKNFLLVFESSFVGDLFHLAKQFTDRGLSIIDFRVQRMNGSPGYLMMTGDDADAVKQDAQEIKRAGCQLTYIGNLSEGFKQFFSN